MNTETDLRPVNWKSGTEALALCMICGMEFPPDARECPDCNVSLSLVRRCPNCGKIVSAQHKKCVYCRTPFTQELPHRDAAESWTSLEDGGPSRTARRFRAAIVSIATFLIVFTLGMLFLRQMNRPAFPLQIVAQAKLIRSAELRPTPSSSASIVSQVAAGATVNLTGIQENDLGRWIAVDWQGTVDYLPISAISAPHALEPREGAKALKFYLSGMDSAEDADEAIRAVDDYAQSFPRDARAHELRLSLADRLRSLAQRGGPHAADLRRLAAQQYDKVADSDGPLSAKARDAAVKLPSSGEQRDSKPRTSPTKKDDLQIIGSTSTQSLNAPPATHDVLVLTQALVQVRPEKISEATAGGVIPAHVVNSVKANGIVAISAGAPCQLTVQAADPAQARISLALTSIEIDHRTYPVRSQVIEVRSGEGMKRTIAFRLEAPLLISR